MINDLAIGELQNERLFIPISLGNHYYSNVILKRINNEIIPHSESALIFICDKLRYYFYKGKIDIPEDKLNIKVAKEVGQFIRTLNNCGLSNCDKVGIKTWDYLQNSANYQKILSNLRLLTVNNDSVANYLSRIVVKNAKKFYKNDDVNNTVLNLQKHFVIEETALSLYITEMVGYNIELYKQLDEGLIVFLYKEKAELLKKILGKKNLNRKFSSLKKRFNASPFNGRNNENERMYA